MFLNPNNGLHAHAVTLEMLEARPDPAPLGSRHVPVRYDEMVRGIIRGVETVFGEKVTGQELVFADKDEGKLVAMFQVGNIVPANGLPEYTRQLALHASDTSKLAARVWIGNALSVCSNLQVFGGDAIVGHKFTKYLNFYNRLFQALAQTEEMEQRFLKQLERLRDDRLTNDDEPKAVIVDAVRQDVLPSQMVKDVARDYFEPSGDMEDCLGRTRFALYSAFTRAFRKLSPSLKVQRSAALSRFFGLQ